MGPRSETTKGYVYALVGAVCSGSVTALAKFLLEYNGPVVVTGAPFLLSGFVLALYQPRRRPERASYGYLLFFGLLGAGLAPLMYIAGLDETTAVNAALLANGEVLFTILLAYFVFGETLGKGQAARGMLIVAGLVVVSTNLDISNLGFLNGVEGNLLVLGSTVVWGVENNLIARATKRFDTSVLSKFRSLIGGAVLTAAALAAGLPLALGYPEALVLVLLALALAGGTYLFIAATKRLGAIKMLLVWSSSTVFGALFAIVFLGEEITLPQLLGGALVLLGVYFFRRGEGQNPAAQA